MIKLLALDLDGTLLNSRGVVSEENKEAIRLAEKKGVLVTIATGRRFRDARPIALEIGFNAPIVTHNGALLKFAGSLETVFSSLIATETVKEILRVGRYFGGDALISVDPQGKGKMLYETVSQDNMPLQKYILWSKRLHGNEAEEAIHHVSNLEDVLDETEVIHISFSGTCAQMTDLQKRLAEELKDTANVLATVYPHLNFTLLDVLPPDASKAAGLHKLASLHGFSPEQVMVVGDNFNDLEMLEYAGKSVIMGNAAPELKAREGFFTTLSNDENGVALAIERFILNGK